MTKNKNNQSYTCTLNKGNKLLTYCQKLNQLHQFIYFKFCFYILEYRIFYYIQNKYIIMIIQQIKIIYSVKDYIKKIFSEISQKYTTIMYKKNKNITTSVQIDIHIHAKEGKLVYHLFFFLLDLILQEAFYIHIKFWLKKKIKKNILLRTK